MKLIKQAVMGRPASGFDHVFRRMAITLAFLATVLFLVPFYPEFSIAHTESWRYAMNVAVAQHMVFGRDIVFTVGPLSAIFTRLYHPATDTSMLVGSFILAVSMFAGYAAITPHRRRPWLVLLPLVLAPFPVEAAMIVGLPLLLVMVAQRAVHEPGRAVTFVTFIVMAACGLLPIVKVTMAISVGACTVLAMVILRRRYAFAILLPCVGLLSMIVAWLLCGQPLDALPDYFLTQVPVTSGYTLGMSLPGKGRDIVIFLVAAPILVWSLLRAGLTVAAAAAFLLFLAWKAGFVRHDAHGLIAAFAIGLVTLASFLEKPETDLRTLCVGALGTVACLGIASSYHLASPSALVATVVDNLSRSWAGLEMRIVAPEQVSAAFDAENQRIRARIPLPAFDGTADLYPEAVSALFAHGQTWHPRPLVTSYTAYGSRLMAMDLDHLEQSGPSRIYFDLHPIDHRYPNLADSLSWPMLLTRYVPRGFAGRYVVLDRQRSGSTTTFGPATERSADFDQEVSLAGRAGPLWARIDVQPTLIGRLMALLFKVPPLGIALRYPDGSSRIYRLIPGIARAGFLLSPTVTSSDEFIALASSARDLLLTNDAPVAIRVFGAGGPRFMWKLRYSLTLQDVRITSSPDADEVLFSSIEPMDSLAGLPIAGQCAIESIDGRRGSQLAGTVDASGLVAMQGWTVAPGNPAEAGDDVSLVFLQDDRAWSAKAQQVTRVDVARRFGLSDPDNLGFYLRVDTRSLHGEYRIVVIQRTSERRIACPVPIAIRLP